MDERILARFLAKVEKRTKVTSPHVDTPCWIWTAAKSRGGYGLMTFDKRTHRAHRLAYAHWVEPIPPGSGYHGTCIMHRCDTPACVNPAHLEAGSIRDNSHDARRKGRLVASGKLTRADVRKIREQHAAGTAPADLAREHDLAELTVWKIVERVTWRNVS